MFFDCANIYFLISLHTHIPIIVLFAFKLNFLFAHCVVKIAQNIKDAIF